MSGAQLRSSRRQVAFSAVTGRLQAAYDRIQELEAVVTAILVVWQGDYDIDKDDISSVPLSYGVPLVCGLDEELIARLAAIMPCLKQQKKFGARSPTGLVSPSKQLFANAAKHNFISDFRTLSAHDARKQQRGGFSCNVPPPAPPPIPDLQSAISCADFEAFHVSLYGGIAFGADAATAINSVEKQKENCNTADFIQAFAQVEDVLQALHVPLLGDGKYENFMVSTAVVAENVTLPTRCEAKHDTGPNDKAKYSIDTDLIDNSTHSTTGNDSVLEEGMVVGIRGLQSPSYLNDNTGIVHGFDVASQEYKILVEDGLQQGNFIFENIKRCNLVPADYEELHLSS